ncbi:hypothetical protein KQ878_03515 [Mycoplasma zalophidermidis]|uniref:Peptidase C1A papain C-terminal domain-containing protein n=1 Tax=Mycoplasma zalophidermidis TaxID=398174 RepID=A0ABS6DSL0_9MOLU|nr:C1 family peptidase [Mycoplasma zalophidermidis]MBU4693936.1 hypothetical protein [Mycoplasma zalophidermidis]
MKIKSLLHLLPITLPAVAISATTNSERNNVEPWKQSKYDQRENYILSPVRRQVSDICWAFSIIGVSEANIVKNGLYKIADSIDLSELSIAYKTKNRSKEADVLRNSASDVYNDDTWNSVGYTYDAGYSVLQWNNLINETSDFKSYDLEVPYLAEDFIEIDHKNIESIKKHVVQNGAVGFSFSTTDAITYYNEKTAPLTLKKYAHAATIVGWDDNIPSEKFGDGTKRNGGWIVKNSWGPNTLEKGYMYVSYETNIANTFTFNYAGKNKYSHNYYYDGFLRNIYNANEKTAAVSFKSKKTNLNTQEYLKSINVGIDGKNARVTVKVYANTENADINPLTYSDSNAVLKTTKTAQFDEGGLRTVFLDENIKLEPNQKFTIVVSVDNDKHDAKLKFSDEEYSDLDLSYVIRNNKWVSSQMEFNGVARIKAFTKDEYKQNNEQKNENNDIINANIKIDKENLYRYGEYLRPKPTLYLNGTVLTENQDYTLSYSENFDKNGKFYKDSSKVGYGLIKFKGINNYTGINEKYFTINVGLYPKINNRTYYHNSNFTIDVDDNYINSGDLNYGPGWEVLNPARLKKGINNIELRYTASDSALYRNTFASIKVNKIDDLKNSENPLNILPDSNKQNSESTESNNIPNNANQSSDDSNKQNSESTESNNIPNNANQSSDDSNKQNSKSTESNNIPNNANQSSDDSNKQNSKSTESNNIPNNANQGSDDSNKQNNNDYKDRTNPIIDNKAKQNTSNITKNNNKDVVKNFPADSNKIILYTFLSCLILIIIGVPVYFIIKKLRNNTT